MDPGSTSAVAAVDLEGDIELLESGKNFPPREIIQRIIKVGKPVVVASDKAKTPAKVEKIASSVGARLYEPESDLESERKKELGKGANSHEIDAVASAVNARKKLHRDVRKIKKKHHEMDLSKDEIAKKVFKGEPFEEKEEESNFSCEEEPGEEKQPLKRDEEKLRMENKIENLEEEVQRLRSELGQKESAIQTLEQKIEELREEERKEVVRDREVRKREAVIRQKKDEIDELERAIEKSMIREGQYMEAMEKIFGSGFRPVPLINESVEEVPEEAVTRDSEILDKLEKRGSEIHHVEDVEGIELRQFMVVDELPDKEDFESVIKEYRRKR